MLTLIQGLLYISLSLLAIPAWPASSINENPLVINSARIRPDHLPAGANAELLLQIELADGHHAYLDQFKLKIESPEGLLFGELKVSPVIEFEDKFSKKRRQGIYQGRAEIRTQIELPESVKPGQQEMWFRLTYQACAKDYCLLPKDIRAMASFKADTPEGVFGWAVYDVTEGKTDQLLERALQRSWWSALLLVFLGGILTSFTPCIFPMIPITLTVLGARAHDRSRRGKFILALLYVLGIAITYAILGLIAGSTGALFGSYLGHPAVALSLGVLFIAMAFGMYGLFEVQAPAFIRNRIGLHQTRGGYLSAFMAGQLAGIIASPCVGPVLVSILAWVARTGDMKLGFVLLFTYAFGIGQLFLVLGTFGQGRWWPKSGPWLNGIKFIFGSLMLMLAIFYVQPLLSARQNDFLIAFLLMLVAAYHSLKLSFTYRSIAQLLAALGLSAMFLWGAHFLWRGIQGASAGLEAQEDKLNHENKIVWQKYSPELIEQAKAAGKPVILDFWAEWCGACHEMEKITFRDAKVQEMAKKFLMIQFDATTVTDEFSELQKRFGIYGLPWLVIFDAKGEYREELTLKGFEKPEPFLERMKQAF